MIFSLIFTGAPVAAAQENGAPLAASAAAYMLIDAQTGAVLATHNANERRSPASLTKLMTALVVFEAVRAGEASLAQEVTVSERAEARQVVGSKMFLRAGTRVTVEELLRGLIVASGNDAALALAEAVAGGEAAFVKRMNAAAARLGLADTAFVNTTGLTAEGHYASARDIAALSLHIIREYPQEYAWFAERVYSYGGIRQENRNGLLGKFAGADGVKTGYTAAAGYCLAASALRRGRRLLAVVLGSEGERAREEEAASLLTHGFATYRNVKLFARDEARGLRVWGGAADEVRVQPRADGVYTLPRSDDVALRVAPRPDVFAPVAAGEKMGVLQVWVNGALHDEVEMVAAESVAAGDWWKRALDKLKVDWLGHGGRNAVFSQW